MEAPALGKLVPEGELRRDAVHVAIAPVTAGERLEPGEKVVLAPGDPTVVYRARHPEEPVGVVDPFLGGSVGEGERFWLCLRPGTVTSLRHVWRHPAFAPKEA